MAKHLIVHKKDPNSVNQKGNARYRLSEDEVNVINEFRRIKTESEQANIDYKDVKHGWLKTDTSSLFFTNPEYGNKIKPEQIIKDLLKDVQKFSPKFKPLKRQKLKDTHLLVIDPADIHIGKLASSFETGEDYNSQIAVKRCLDGVDGILNKAHGFNIDKILFIGGNDILHIDTPKRTTTSGTPQDTDGMWYDNFLKAKQLYLDILEKLITIADVQFTFNPSNHDFMNGFFLADTIKTYYRNCKNIEFNVDMSHRKYYRYGNNLIGTTHGDGAKPHDLPLLMAQESKEWSSTKHRYVYTHHVHHKVSKDMIGVTVESLRSASGADGWHHRNGYQHNPKAVEGFIHHPEHGQIARLTNIF
jgi:hypothetical protein